MILQGFILDRTQYAKLQQVWVEGQPEESFWTGLKTGNRESFYVQAFRCTACNYLEFHATDEVDVK